MPFLREGRWQKWNVDLQIWLIRGIAVNLYLLKVHVKILCAVVDDSGNGKKVTWWISNRMTLVYSSLSKYTERHWIENFALLECTSTPLPSLHATAVDSNQKPTQTFVGFLTMPCRLATEGGDLVLILQLVFSLLHCSADCSPWLAWVSLACWLSTRGCYALLSWSPN
jgi:hypothetical protein